MKVLLVACLCALVFQQTSAIFYHDWYDWYDDDVSPWCKHRSREIAYVIKNKVTPQQLDKFDETLLECLVEQNLLGYVIKYPAGNNQMGNNPFGNNPAANNPIANNPMATGNNPTNPNNANSPINNNMGNNPNTGNNPNDPNDVANFLANLRTRYRKSS